MEIEPQYMALIPVVTGIVWAARHYGWPERALPLLAILVGGLAGLALAYQDPAIHPTAGLIGGIIVGLASSGFWSNSKAAVRTVQERRQT